MWNHLTEGERLPVYAYEIMVDEVKTFVIPGLSSMKKTCMYLIEVVVEKESNGYVNNVKEIDQNCIVKFGSRK